jgi:hypothetical protein
MLEFDGAIEAAAVTSTGTRSWTRMMFQPSIDAIQRANVDLQLQSEAAC